MIIEKFDDPALLAACDVYASLDGIAFTLVGTAPEPCTDTNPFKIHVVPQLAGTEIQLKFAPMGTQRFARTHGCVIREKELWIAAL